MLRQFFCLRIRGGFRRRKEELCGLCSISTSSQRLSSSRAQEEKSPPPRSALFISGKQSAKTFKLLSPDLFPGNLTRRKEILKTVLKCRNVSLDLDELERDLLHYNELKTRSDQMRQERKSLQEEIKVKKKETDTDPIVIQELIAKESSLKSGLSALNEEIWAMEERAVHNYLQLPNCDNLTVLEDKVVSTLPYNCTDSQDKSTAAPEHSLLTYDQLIERDELVEYSANSHTSYYLFSTLAKLELRLCWRIQQTLLDEGFEQFSNPDFVKTIGIEGISGDTEGKDLLNLLPTQDFGDRESLNAMYLVGGASKYPLISYFARHTFQNPQVLPLNIFSIGRQYSQVTEENCSLLNTQQSTAITFLNISASRSEMELNLDRIINIYTHILQDFGEVRIIQKGASDLDLCEETKYVFHVFLPVSKKFVQVGELSVEGDYYSRRLMFKQKDEQQTYRNVWTLSGTVLNITRVLPIVLETTQNNPKLIQKFCD